MLKIVNNLSPFFQDCYRRISVREYARILGVSAPTASSRLSEYMKEGLLLQEKQRNYIFYLANRKNKVFIDLSRVYWNSKLSGLVSFLERELVNPAVVLFGSLSKGEAKQDSDLDIAIFAVKKGLDFGAFEKKLGRKVQVFWYNSLKGIQSEELANNITNGYLLSGKLKL